MFDRAGEAAGCGVIDGVSSAKDSIRSTPEMRLPEQMTAAVPTVRVSYSLQALQIQFGPGLQSFHLQAEEKYLRHRLEGGVPPRVGQAAGGLAAP